MVRGQRKCFQENSCTQVVYQAMRRDTPAVGGVGWVKAGEIPDMCRPAQSELTLPPTELCLAMWVDGNW